MVSDKSYQTIWAEAELLQNGGQQSDHEEVQRFAQLGTPAGYLSSNAELDLGNFVSA